MRTESRAELIAKIAHVTQMPVADVERAFCSTWDELYASAKIHDYLPLFVAKRVTEDLLKVKKGQV
ncbi:hypothetical protein OR16_07816 [Cupriavidus basilensis OR16]|uniref:DUF3562 domain-containing protein n=1 Tax=Cupriavidus basilensis OR16 TaxID=1127483 RepID=H1S1M2_9BURK|nr:DUF3562 domain-containing protein [Cupriavidus basilensis]EHP43597.1 hypothetical protein OR16_07816 [Cupriavidus basilensis OR16]